MDIVKQAEEYFRNNLPSSRPKEVYVTHVDLVRKYALMLGEEYSADLIVVEVAALLHDVGADAGKIHAHRSAEMIEVFLDEKDVSVERKESILAAIRSHSMPRGDGPYEEVPLEVQIVRDADGIAFLEDTYKWYLEKSYELEDGEDAAKSATLKKIDGMIGKIRTVTGIGIAKRFQQSAREHVSASSRNT